MTAAELPTRPRTVLGWRLGIPWKVFRIAAFYVGLVAAWELLFRAQLWPDYVFPSPRDVWDTIWFNLRNGTIGDATALTMKRMAIGYLLSIVIGLFVGVAMGTLKWVDETVGSLVLGLQSLPSVTWLPLALLWFGLNEKAIIFVVLMGSVNSIAISSRAGVRAIPALQLRAARMFGGSWWQRYGLVVIPGMLPQMVQGLKLGWSFAWRSLLAAELLFVSQSLGFLLQTGRDLNDVQLVMSIMIVIVVIGIAVDRIVFGRLEAWVADRWGLPR